MLSILRIVVGTLYMEHGLAEILDSRTGNGQGTEGL
jgi:hypothetical protein